MINFIFRYKKLFRIFLFLFVIIILSWLLWNAFFKTKSSPQIKNGKKITTNSGLPVAKQGNNINGGFSGPGTLPNKQSPDQNIDQGKNIPRNKPSEIAVGGITKTKLLNKSIVSDLTASNNNGTQYYNRDDGKFYRIDKNGNVIPLSNKVFYNVTKVVWSKDKTKGIIEYPDGNKIMYNFNTQKQVSLPKHWKDFSFSPNDTKIVAKSIGLDPENRWLITANPDGSNAENIVYIGRRENYVYPDWSPNKQIIATYTKGIDFNRQQVFFVGLHGENFKSTVIEGRGLESQWSTKGDKLLYSVYNGRDDYKPRLWIVNAVGDTIGQNRHSFDLATWSNKCTFASDTEVYCAVPRNLEKGAGLYPELADKTQDDLYKIDLKTGTKQLIAVPNGAYNISKIVIPDSQDSLYFTDKKSGRLYNIRLR